MGLGENLRDVHAIRASLHAKSLFNSHRTPKHLRKKQPYIIITPVGASTML